MHGIRDIDQIDMIPQENKSNICHSFNAFVLTHFQTREKYIDKNISHFEIHLEFSVNSILRISHKSKVETL